MQRYPGAALLISGEGPLEKELQEKVAGMGLKNRIFFLGFVENLPDFLASLDIFVLPSRTEGLGIILLEALAGGVPVLATRVGGIPEIITSETHGLLVPAQDPEQLAAGIEKLWEDEGLRRTLVKKGKERIRERFLLQDMLIKTGQVYEAVTRERDRL
jgi:glycosyltransferase involved in cell wall biosynthesis